MRLPRGRERLLYTDVELTTAAEREPGAAARAQRLGFLELLQAQQVAEEATRLRLAAVRCRELDMV